MASRTYIPLLLDLLYRVCQYITRHRARILEVIGSQHADKLDAIMTACDAFVTVARPFLEDPV